MFSSVLYAVQRRQHLLTELRAALWEIVLHILGSEEQQQKIFDFLFHTDYYDI